MGREEIRTPLKMPLWEANYPSEFEGAISKIAFSFLAKKDFSHTGRELQQAFPVGNKAGHCLRNMVAYLSLEICQRFYKMNFPSPPTLILLSVYVNTFTYCIGENRNKLN